VIETRKGVLRVSAPSMRKVVFARPDVAGLALPVD
jgi:hypothetical protein